MTVYTYPKYTNTTILGGSNENTEKRLCCKQCSNIWKPQAGDFALYYLHEIESDKDATYKNHQKKKTNDFFAIFKL